MRTSITVARKHGQTAFTLIHGPEVLITTQADDFRELLQLNGVHPEIAEVQRWTFDGQDNRTLKFEKPEVRKARVEKLKAENAKHAEMNENPAKAAKAATEAAKKAKAETEAKNKAAHDKVTAEQNKKAAEQAKKNLEAHKKTTAEAQARWEKANPEKAAALKGEPKKEEEGGDKAPNGAESEEPTGPITDL